MFQRKIRSYFIFSIDSTFSGSIVRYINDTPKRYANCKIEKIINQGRPHLILVAKKDIPVNTELRYCYGDTRNLWWREQVVSLNKLFRTKCFTVCIILSLMNGYLVLPFYGFVSLCHGITKMEKR